MLNNDNTYFPPLYKKLLKQNYKGNCLRFLCHFDIILKKRGKIYE